MFTLRELVEDWHESGAATWLVLDEPEVHSVAVRAARFVHGWTNLQSIAALDREPPKILGGRRQSLCSSDSKTLPDYSADAGRRGQGVALHPKNLGGSIKRLCNACSKEHRAIKDEFDYGAQEVDRELAGQMAETGLSAADDSGSIDSRVDSNDGYSDGGGADGGNAVGDLGGDSVVGLSDGAGFSGDVPLGGCSECKGKAAKALPKPKNPRFVSSQTKVSTSEWALIMPLFTLYAERECAMRLEASRAMGIEVYGRSVSEIASEITAMEQDTIPRKAFLEDVMTIGDDLDDIADSGCLGGGSWRY